MYREFTPSHTYGVRVGVLGEIEVTRWAILLLKLFSERFYDFYD